MARVVVIGAGMAGLAAAARLARLRHDVVVCEAADGPGGQAGRYSRDGFSFDTGPGLLTLPAAYRDLFIKTGKTTPLENYVELTPVDPAVRWRFADGTTVDLPNASRARATEALTAAFGAKAAHSWHAFVDTGDGVWAVFRRGFYTPPPQHAHDELLAALGDAPRRLLVGRSPARSPSRTLAALARARLSDPRLRQAAGSYALRAGSDPRRTDPCALYLPYVESTFGTWAVAGGVRALVDAVAARAESRGVKLRYGAAVDALVRDDGGRVAGVRLAGGETVAAEIVVAAVSAGQLCGSLLQATGGGVEAPGGESASVFTLLLAVRGGDPGRPRHSVCFPADADAECDDVFGRRARPCPEPTVHVLTGDPASAPAGHEAWTVTVAAARHARGVPREGSLDWAAAGLADSYADTLLAVLARRGLDVRGRVLWRHAISPADHEARWRAPGGALSGPALHGDAGLFRPPNAAGVPGLFHVGASAHPGPGLAMVVLGSPLIAEEIGRA